MANSFSLKSKAYETRYLKLDCIQTKDVVNNRSRIDWKLTSTGGLVRNYSTGPTTVIINGTTVYNKPRVSYTTNTFPAAKGSVSGFTYVSPDEEGNATIEVSITTAIYTSTLSTVKGSWTLDNIPQNATMVSAPDFNDTQKELTITYRNPWGEELEYLGACISLTGANDDVAYREIDKLGTSYTFTLTDEDIAMLQKNTQGGDSRRVRFYLKSVRDGEFKFDWLERTFKILDAQPPTIAPKVEETNELIARLTNSNKFIKYYSNISYEVNATPHKNAEVLNYRVSTNGETLNTDTGSFNNIYSDKITFSVTDSRNKTTTQDFPLNFVDYRGLTCEQKLGELNLEDSQTASVTVTIFGQYFDGSFGAVDNTLSIFIRHTNNEGDMGDWVELTQGLIPTIENGTYSLDFTISGLYYDNTYTFQSKVVDELNEIESLAYTTKLNPVFDWGKDDFKFNVPVTVNAKDILTVPFPDLENTGERRLVKFLGYEDDTIYNDGAFQLGFKDEMYGDFDFNIYGGSYLNLHAPNAISLNTDSIFIGDNVLADFVIDEGTESMGSNGTWHWRKWKSGLAEAWGKRNFGNVGFSTAYGVLYRSETFTQSLPSIFDAEPTYIDIQPMEGSGGTWVLRGLDTNISASSTGGFALCRPNTTSLSQVHLGFYVRGTWE